MNSKLRTARCSKDWACRHRDTSHHWSTVNSRFTACRPN